MITYFRTILLLAVGLTTATVFADNPAIEGSVKGPDGKSVAGGEVRIERVDGKSAPITAKTNSKGHYAVSTLPLDQSYKVTAYINNAPKSRAVVKTRKDSRLEIDFNLASKDSRPQIKRYVWVKGETGTLFGGKWVPVDETNGPSANPILRRVSRVPLEEPVIRTPRLRPRGPTPRRGEVSPPGRPYRI
jgi:hypothetical protein